jgi:hypothetical protein
MQQNSSILIRQHSAIAHPIRPHAIERQLEHWMLLDRRHDLCSAENLTMAWISAFEPIALR